VGVLAFGRVGAALGRPHPETGSPFRGFNTERARLPTMYAVVGCDRCSALWVVEGRPETTACPQCEKRHRFERLRALAETDTAAAAKEARSRILAERSGVDADLEDVASMGEAVDDAGMSDEEYLEAAGLDADAVTEAGEDATGRDATPSRQEAVRMALRDLDAPTADEVAEHAAEHGVDREYVERALAKLRRRGEVSESRGRYRLL
jgi:DNA replicative helicase MCM subunit Mcm2 (Cdc46/Mcm family)